MFAITDIETTGGSALHNRITEIAIYLHDGEKIVDQFSTLINPECMIPAFITRLTGIDNDMVRDAPKFFEVAKKIVELTENSVFVAHNVQFDYGFVRQEFKNLGFNFSRDYLCTVKLSRKLIPGFNSYSLGSLCERLGISISGRHRAAGDALATVKLFELLLSKDVSRQFLSHFVKNDYLHLRFPPGFNKSVLDKLPEKPGVYYIHNEDGTLIYIGKSNNIRKRILSHFSNKQSKKSIELRNCIHDITFEETGNELVALLLESSEIKKHQPLFNRAQRRTRFNFGIFYETDQYGYIRLSSGRINGRLEPLVSCTTAGESAGLMEQLIRDFGLCQKLCGISNIAHACFAYSIHQCKGACIGREKPESYNKRAEKAIQSLEFIHPNFMIIGNGRTVDENTVVQVEHGKYQGFGYFEKEFMNGSLEDLRNVITRQDDNRDIHKILQHFLIRCPGDRIITY
ncbi:MAG: GIY-YIG nuclease family protein [Bacteroidia bacterium]|nr:GIY-YIG nuclease family protein [Bacteroidia bacterium]